VIAETVRRRLNEQPGVCTDEDVRERIAETVLRDPRLSCCSVREKRELAEAVFAVLRRELGLLDAYAGDDSVSEIMVNGTDAVFIERNGTVERAPFRFENAYEIEEIARRLAAKVHREINELHPILDARMEDGSRVHCVYKNVAVGGPVLNIRRFPTRSIGAGELVRSGTAGPEAMDFLRSAVEAGMNLFVSGGTSSGKTTLLNALCSFIPERERVIVIEDAAELRIRGIPNLVRMEIKEANSRERGAITMADLIRSSLRMRPDRIIVGEVRGGEVVDMIQAMNTGHDGSLSTGHGNSPEGMLGRLEAMYLAATQYPLTAIRRQIADAIDLLVHLGRFPDGSRHILKIVEIAGITDDKYEINQIFHYKFKEGIVPTGNRLRRTEKFERRGIRPGGGISFDPAGNGRSGRPLDPGNLSDRGTVLPNISRDRSGNPDGPGRLPVPPAAESGTGETETPE